MNLSRRAYALRPSQLEAQEKSKQVFLFNLADGTVVNRGDTLFVHPSFIKDAGIRVTAEFKPKGMVVTARADNGAVPVIPIALLSATPFPDMDIKLTIAKKLNINVWDVNDRDVGIFKLGMRNAS